MNKLNKKTIIYLGIIIITIIIIYYFFIKDKDYIEVESNLSIQEESINNTTIKENIKEQKEKIYITGQVKNNGVYEIEENSRISDCIEKAGGLTENADIENINLAFIVEDGMKIYIPKKGEKIEQKDEEYNYIQTTINDSDNIYQNNSTKSEKNSKTKSKININTATQTELETLPGIGPSTAKKILDYKKENGKFNNIEDIKKVNGIGESKYKQIKDLIKI